MSQAQAVAFLDRVENDDDLAKELESLKDDPPAVLDTVRAAGFDATPDEIKDVFLERYGAELTQEQMDQIAAGSDPAVVWGVTGAVALEEHVPDLVGGGVEPGGADLVEDGSWIRLQRLEFLGEVVVVLHPVEERDRLCLAHVPPPSMRTGPCACSDVQTNRGHVGESNANRA